MIDVSHLMAQLHELVQRIGLMVREDAPRLPIDADLWEVRTVWYLTAGIIVPPQGEGPWWLVSTSSQWSERQGVDVGVWARRRPVKSTDPLKGASK